MLVLKITLLLVKKVFFGVKKGISEFWLEVAKKHTAHPIKHLWWSFFVKIVKLKTAKT